MNMAATSKPVWSKISWKQVGLVTFTSVRLSPMMSRPTSSRPRAASTGPSASAISRSRSEMGWARPVPPAARLPRTSPACGMRASAKGTGLPSMTSTRLSPWTMAGMYFWAMMVRVPSSVSISTTEPRFMPSSLTRKMPAPPMPSRGLKMTSPCWAWKARRRVSLEVTRVGAVNCENWAIDSFSLWLRMAAGLLKMRALLFRQFQQLGQVDVLHVERRVLAFDDGVEKFEAVGRLAGHLEPLVGLAGHLDMRHRRLDHAVFQRHVALLEGVQGVAAPGRFAHHGEGRVLVNFKT